MKCPYCDGSFSLSWRRHWRSKHQCPSCGHSSRLEGTTLYLLLTTAYWGALIVVALFTLNDYDFHAMVPLRFRLAIYLGLFLFIDSVNWMLSAKFSKLIKCE